MKINRLIIAICIIVLIFGGIYLSQALGWWQTTNSGGGGGKNIFTSSSQEHGDAEDHDDTQENEVLPDGEILEEHESSEAVSGSTTVAQVLEMGISREQLVATIGEYESEDQLIKDVATANGLSFGKVKESLATLINQ